MFIILLERINFALHALQFFKLKRALSFKNSHLVKVLLLKSLVEYRLFESKYFTGSKIPWEFYVSLMVDTF